MTAITGKLVFLDQSSNTGGFWAFMPDTNYEPFPVDTYILHDGDVLTVLDPENSGQTIWTGTIALQPVPLITESIQGHWIRNTQQGVGLMDWYRWFEGEYPATLTTTQQVDAYPDYPNLI